MVYYIIYYHSFYTSLNHLQNTNIYTFFIVILQELIAFIINLNQIEYLLVFGSLIYIYN